MGHKTLEDLEEDGFEIYSSSEKKSRLQSKATSDAHNTAVAADNSDLLKAIGDSNLTHLQSSEMTAKSFQYGIEKLIEAMADRPDSFTLDIERDERGFMKTVNVKVNK